MPLVDRLLDAAERRFGVRVVDSERVEALEESMVRFEQFKSEAEELAWWSLDYFGGRPQELRPEKRQRLAHKSRIALQRDPLAGTEANHLTNFAFGKGVGIPDAEEEAVQEVIDEAWNDSVNRQKLTSFEAQRHRSFQLITDANLFPVAYIRGGRLRLGFLNTDRVVDIICDPDDDERPLWYVYDEPEPAEYDFENDRWLLRGEGSAWRQQERDRTGLRRRVYYPHWRNVEEIRREREAHGLPQLEEPHPTKIGDGVVQHVRINRIGRSQWGVPPWARTLRFYTAMNEVVDAHVSMAQAASQFIAKRVMRGSPEQVMRAANSILAQTGEIAATRFGDDGNPPQDLIDAGMVPPAGATVVENEQDRLEPFSMNSGAAQAHTTTTIIRGQALAPSGFGQHYAGDASNANLATATSLELPTLMTVQAWQQTFKDDMFRWFTDLAIEVAVRAGRLGGYGVAPEIPRALSELRLNEAEDKAEAERRTGTRLDYKIGMPYPGRRNLPDVVAMATSVAAAFDPSGVNVELRRALLLELATHGLQIEDAPAWVDQVMPEEIADAVAQMALLRQRAELAALTQQADPNAQPAGGGGAPPTKGRQSDRSVSRRNGEVPRSAPASAMAEALMAEFDEQVSDPILAYLQGRSA